VKVAVATAAAMPFNYEDLSQPYWTTHNQRIQLPVASTTET